MLVEYGQVDMVSLPGVDHKMYLLVCLGLLDGSL